MNIEHNILCRFKNCGCKYFIPFFCACSSRYYCPQQRLPEKEKELTKADIDNLINEFMGRKA